MLGNCIKLTSITLSPLCLNDDDSRDLFNDTLPNLTIRTAPLRFPFFRFTPTKNFMPLPSGLDPRLAQGSRGFALCVLLCLQRRNKSGDTGNEAPASIPSELAFLFCWWPSHQHQVIDAAKYSKDNWKAQVASAREAISNPENTMNPHATFWHIEKQKTEETKAEEAEAEAEETAETSPAGSDTDIGKAQAASAREAISNPENTMNPHANFWRTEKQKTEETKAEEAEAEAEKTAETSPAGSDTDIGEETKTEEAATCQNESGYAIAWHWP